MKLKLIPVAVFFFAVAAMGQTIEKPELKDLNVDFMLRGYFFAETRVQDQGALGGFASSDNLPKTIETNRSFPADSVSLIALPDEETVFAKEFKGIKVLLANTTKGQLQLSASDSRLYIIQEAVDSDGKWKPVEYLPSSWCGNSYHSVFLGPNEYWEFAGAKLTGKLKTQLRFRLQVSNRDKTKFIYSNEFEGSVNPKQFTVQQGHTPGSIMDPYNN